MLLLKFILLLFSDRLYELSCNTFFSEHKTLWCLSVLISVKLFHSLSNYISEYAQFNRLGIFLIYLLITRSTLASVQRLLCPKFQAGINIVLTNLMCNEIRVFCAHAGENN